MEDRRVAVIVGGEEDGVGIMAPEGVSGPAVEALEQIPAVAGLKIYESQRHVCRVAGRGESPANRDGVAAIGAAGGTGV